MIRPTIYSLAFAMSISACQGGDSELLQAMIQVESNGDDKAWGDYSKKTGLPRAAGCLQIHAIMVDDVNRIAGTNYKWPDDCFDRVKSSEMWRVYMDAYCKGKADDVKARCWNSGPRGFTKKCSMVYWSKVNKILEKNKNEAKKIPDKR